MNDVSRMGHVRATIAAVITAAVRTIKWGLDQKLQLLAGHLSAIQLQKIYK